MPSKNVARSLDSAATVELCCPECESLARVAHRTRYNANRFARHCGSSLRCLERDMSGSVAFGPKQFLNALRAMEAARWLLGGHQMKEVVYEFSYYDTAHFSRSLKEHLGVPPSHIVGAGLTSGRILLSEKVAFIQHAAVALFKILQQRRDGINSTPQVSPVSPQLVQ